MKKSELVRNMIRDAKVAGAVEADDAFIKAVMAATGHTRQLARAYIKNNWPKVVIEAVAAATEAAGAAPADTAPTEADVAALAPVAEVAPAKALTKKEKKAAAAAAKAAEVAAAAEVPAEA